MKMSEYECRYLFEPVKVDVTKYVKDAFVTETVYDETKKRFYPFGYNTFHKPQPKILKQVTSTFNLDEVDFDTIYRYEGNDKMIIILNGKYFEVDHYAFKNKYSQAFPKYTFPKQCEINLIEYKEEVKTDKGQLLLDAS